MNAATPIMIAEEVMAKAEDRARSLGINVTEYVQSLVIEDVEHVDDPWRQPLPWEVEKQYLLDEIEFYEAEKNLPQKAAYSTEELMNLLDEEIQLN